MSRPEWILSGQLRHLARGFLSGRPPHEQMPDTSIPALACEAMKNPRVLRKDGEEEEAVVQDTVTGRHARGLCHARDLCFM